MVGPAAALNLPVPPQRDCLHRLSEQETRHDALHFFVKCYVSNALSRVSPFGIGDTSARNPHCFQQFMGSWLTSLVSF